MEATTLAGDLAGLLPLVGEYWRRRPEETVLYRVIQENLRTFAGLRDEQGRPLPPFILREFEKYLTCGQLSEGFSRIRCGACGYDRLVAFSCKSRGFCGSCTGRRMNDGAAFLADRVIGDTPIRQWVLSLPRPLRYLLAYDSTILGEVVGAFVGSVFACASELPHQDSDVLQEPRVSDDLGEKVEILLDLVNLAEGHHLMVLELAEHVLHGSLPVPLQVRQVRAFRSLALALQTRDARAHEERSHEQRKSSHRPSTELEEDRLVQSR